jgi:DNA adenine methylase
MNIQEFITKGNHPEMTTQQHQFVKLILPSCKERNEMITQPIKWHGGKHYLAQWIINQMPPHLHYVEPFFGGGSVLLARDPMRDWLKGHPDWSDVAAKRGASEVINDLCGVLTNFWRVLQDENLFEQFQRKVSATPFSSDEWQDAAKPDKDPISQAVAFFVRVRQSMAGRQDCFTPLTRTRTRGKRNEQANAWWNAIEGLPEVHRRLQGVVILNEDAIQVIKKQDNNKTLFYLDPPYVHSTRTAGNALEHAMRCGDWLMERGCTWEKVNGPIRSPGL